MVVASWVVWSIVVFFLFFLCWETTSISAWGTSWLDNTTAHHCVGIITVSVDGNRTSKNRCQTVKSEVIIPVVVISKTSVASSHQLVGEFSFCVFVSS